MTDAFYRYLNCHVRHVLVLFFIHKIWCLQNRNHYQQFQNKLSRTIQYLNQKFHETIAGSQKYELNVCHIHHVTYVMGEMEKIENDFHCLFFFSKWPKEQLQSFDFNQNVAILENYNGLLCQYLSYQGQFLAMTMEDCQDHQFLLLKHQDFMQTTKYSLKLSKFTKNRINLK